MKRRFPLPLLFVLASLGGCASVDRNLMAVTNAISSHDPVTGAREINLMSEQAEIQQGSTVANSLMQQVRAKQIPHDQQLVDYAAVKRVFGRLLQVVHRKNLPWEVHLIGDNTWNAFTVGAGKVFLFNGLMQGPTAIRGDDELAVVLAHEMAHNTARHIGESEGKSLLGRLADKGTASDLYQASFSTNQEAEADKFSVIYMALAGYDPMAAVQVWARMAQHQGNHSVNMLHTHPLNGDRAQRLAQYAGVARQYYQPGLLNPQAAAFVVCNAIYCNQSGGAAMQAGQGGGALALLETVANAYVETQAAKAEAAQRQQQLAVQSRTAAAQLRFSDVRLVKLPSGLPGASGVVENAPTRSFSAGVVRVQYLQGGQVVGEQQIKWPGMKAGERQPFTVDLKPGNYDNVRLLPEFIQ